MKFLCPTMCQREVCTDDGNDDANDDDARRTKHDYISKALWLINQMSQNDIS